MRHPLVPSLTLLGLLALGCASDPWDTPFSATPEGQRVRERAMTRDRARAILENLPERDRRSLDQLMFLADLPTASGNETDPVRLYQRTLRELADPLVVSPEQVDLVLRHMAARVEVWEPPKEDVTPHPGYEAVREMLSVAGGALPSTGVCLERIASWPGEASTAFLVQEYFADDHYWPHEIQGRIVEILATSDRGMAPLQVMEHALMTRYPSDYDATWRTLQQWGRRELGKDYGAWYTEIRGKSAWWEATF